jgi:Ca2+-binding EF-hand superfamily protein
MQEKLKEMLLVIRPPEIKERIPTKDLSYILTEMGYEFLTSKAEDIAAILDEEKQGFFNPDDLVEHLMTNYLA